MENYLIVDENVSDLRRRKTEPILCVHLTCATSVNETCECAVVYIVLPLLHCRPAVDPPCCAVLDLIIINFSLTATFCPPSGVDKNT